MHVEVTVNAVKQFEKSLKKREQRLFTSLKSPAKIQDFLDSILYKAEEFYQSARGVLRYRKANCFDGALLAAAALRQCGQRPLLLYMIAENDDGLEMISQRFDMMKRYPLLTSSMAASLSPVQKLSYKANMLGVNVAGIYQPLPGRKSRRS